MANARQEFTPKQKEAVRAASAAWVKKRWPELGEPPHYFCESCGFVSRERADYEVDHVYAAAKGGHGDRHHPSALAGLHARFPDLEVLAQIGLQAQLLCWECNRKKRDADFPRRGLGFAFTRPHLDRNPEHRYHGVPTMTSQ